MSDSDDTDLLLVIPPNFFAIDSDESDTSCGEPSLCKSFKFKPKQQDGKELVSNLLSTFNELAGRVSVLENIEGSRHSDCGENFLQPHEMSFQNMSALRGSTDSLSLHSHRSSSNYLNRSPVKSNRPQSLPPTPVTNRYQQTFQEEFSRSHSLNTSPEKGGVLFPRRNHQKAEGDHRIQSKAEYTSAPLYDHSKFPDDARHQKFFSAVDSRQVNPALENYSPNHDFKSCFTQSYLESKNLPQIKSYLESTNPLKHLDLPEVDRLLKEMEITQEEIESKSKSKDPLPHSKDYFSSVANCERDLPDRSHINKDTLNPKMCNTGKPESSSEKNHGCVRRLDFDFNKLKESQNLTSGKDISDEITRRNVSKFSLSSQMPEDAVPKSMTGFFETGNLNRELYKIDSQTSIIDGLRELDKKTQEIVENSLPQSQHNSDLRELNSNFSRLLNSQANDNAIFEQLKHKLEEEHCRRQHYENLVIDLQQEVLEWRERLAVAVAIDAEKNRAIGKLETTWRRTVEHWRQLEDQRHNLAIALQTVKEETRETVSELHQKIRRNELELSQALDLAAGYKMKADAAEKENFELGMKIAEIEEISKNAGTQMKESEDKILLLQEKLTLMERNYSEEHQLLQESQERLNQLEGELLAAKGERDKLMAKVREDDQLVESLKEEKKNLLLAVDEAKEKEKKILEDMRNSQRNQEKLKKELRAFYQKQLESVVRDKLKEFQSQLDSSEAALKAELHTRERALAELAARQMQLLNEKHKLELEKAHEETRDQTKKSEILIADLKRSLEMEKSRRAEMARELHTVMETQWRQALSIITSQANASMKQEPTNEKGEPANAFRGFDDTYALKVESNSMPDQLQKYFQTLLEKIPSNKDDPNISWLSSSFLSEDLAGPAVHGEVLLMDHMNNMNPNYDGSNYADCKSNQNSKTKPPWK